MSIEGCSHVSRASGYCPECEETMRIVEEALQDQRDKLLAEQESGTPTEGSRLWRCEKALAKARELYAAERETRVEADRAYQERTDLLSERESECVRLRSALEMLLTKTETLFRRIWRRARGP